MRHFYQRWPDLEQHSSHPAEVLVDHLPPTLLINSVYIGDYHGVTADRLTKAQGFPSAYGNNARGNPDVRISRRFGGSDDTGAQDDN